MMNPQTVIEENSELIGKLVRTHHSRNKNIAVISQDDLYQCVCERIINDLDRYDKDRADLAAFINLLTTQAIFAEYRKLSWKRRAEEREDRNLGTLDSVEEEYLGLEDSSLDPTSLDIKEFLDELPARQRFILLAVESGYSHREISEMLDISTGRVHQIGTATMEKANFGLGVNRKKIRLYLPLIR